MSGRAGWSRATSLQKTGTHSMSRLAGWSKVAWLQNTGTIYVKTGRVKQSRLHNTGKVNQKSHNAEYFHTFHARIVRVEQSIKTSKYWHTLCQEWQGGVEYQDWRKLVHSMSGHHIILLYSMLWMASWNRVARLQNTHSLFVRTGSVELSSKTAQYLHTLL